MKKQTLVALWAAEQLGSDTVLVLVPSLAVHAALKALGGPTRIAILTPYQPPGDEAAEGFFSDAGYDVVRLKGLKCASPLAIAAVSEGEIRAEIEALNGNDVEAIIQVAGGPLSVGNARHMVGHAGRTHGLVLGLNDRVGERDQHADLGAVTEGIGGWGHALFVMVRPRRCQPPCEPLTGRPLLPRAASVQVESPSAITERIKLL